MGKFIVRLFLISGITAGIAYWKKDKILNALIRHSITVDQLNHSVDNVIAKATDVKTQLSKAKQELKQSKNTLNELRSDVNNYKDETQPIVNNLRHDLNH